MNKEQLIAQKSERDRKYYSLRSDIHYMKENLGDIKFGVGNTNASKLLMIALDVFEDQINRDYDRYVKRISSIAKRDELKELQQSLNRERKIRADLENKIEEAKTSSGLFVDYLRKKFNWERV